jgi:hypothetical protein
MGDLRSIPSPQDKPDHFESPFRSSCSPAMQLAVVQFSYLPGFC